MKNLLFLTVLFSLFFNTATNAQNPKNIQWILDQDWGIHLMGIEEKAKYIVIYEIKNNIPIPVDSCHISDIKTNLNMGGTLTTSQTEDKKWIVAEVTKKGNWLTFWTKDKNIKMIYRSYEIAELTKHFNAPVSEYERIKEFPTQYTPLVRVASNNNSPKTHREQHAKLTDEEYYLLFQYKE